MSEKRLTDLSYFEELGMGDEGLLIEMIEMFLQNTPESIGIIRDNIEQDNWKKVSAEAHKMKPNLSYMGLDEAWDLIVGVEKKAKTDPVKNELMSDIERVDSICQKAYIELEEELEGLKK